MPFLMHSTLLHFLLIVQSCFYRCCCFILFASNFLFCVLFFYSFGMTHFGSGKKCTAALLFAFSYKSVFFCVCGTFGFGVLMWRLVPLMSQLELVLALKSMLLSQHAAAAIFFNTTLHEPSWKCSDLIDRGVRMFLNLNLNRIFTPQTICFVKQLCNIRKTEYLKLAKSLYNYGSLQQLAVAWAFM